MRLPALAAASRRSPVGLVAAPPVMESGMHTLVPMLYQAGDDAVASTSCTYSVDNRGNSRGDQALALSCA